MSPSPRLQRHLPSVVLVALLHTALLYALLQSRQPADNKEPVARGPAIQWLLNTRPPPTNSQPLSIPVPAQISAAAARPSRPSAPMPMTPASSPAPATDAPVAASPVEATASAQLPSASEIREAAKRQIGQIDKELRRQFPHGASQKLEDTDFKRMQRGFADAYAAVPPKWYEASRIEEIGSDSKSGTRVYKITSALGSICISMIPGHGGESMVGTCP